MRSHSFSKLTLALAAIAVVGLLVSWPGMAYTASFTALGDLPGGLFFSVANGASVDGSVVVGRSRSSVSGSGNEAFRWTSGGGMAALGDLPGGAFSSQAWGVSADGSVVVGQGRSASGLFGSEVFEAFRWTSVGGMVGLGDLPGGGFESQARGVSADGSVVVGRGFSNSGVEAFSWTSVGGMVGLDDLTGGFFVSEAWDVSADGSVIVGLFSLPWGFEAFIWDDVNGMQFLMDVLVNDFGLDLTGWTLGGATGISDDGLTIVGWGTNPSGFTEAWVAQVEPIPEPATLLLLGSGLLGLAGWRRKRRAA